MDYGKVLSRAWQITWRWKVLWILGFLVSLGSGFGSGSNFYDFGEQDLERWSRELQSPQVVGTVMGVLIGVACLAVVIGIALWVVSVMARGGLIAGVQQVEDEGSTTFRQAWRVGRKRFWTLFGISFLASIPIIILVLVFVVAAVAWIVPVARSSAAGDESGIYAFVAIGLACTGALCCGLVLAAILLGQIQIYAERAAILEGLGWIDAFKRGWQVLRANIGPTIVFWLIFALIGLVFAVVVFAGVLALVVPLVAIVGHSQTSAWWLVPVCLGGFVAWVLGAFIQSVYQTFHSATWTLVYRQLTGPVLAAAQQPSSES